MAATSPNGSVETWRHRTANERTGLPKRDHSGFNASASLLWCPTSQLHLAEHWQYGSRKRASQLKGACDIGTHAERNASCPTALGGPCGGPGQRQWSASALSVRGRPGSRAARPGADSSSVTLSTPQDTGGVRRGEVECAALARASELRTIGESYLRVGNLREARAHFQRADALLQMDEAKYQRQRQALGASAEYRLTGLPKGDSYL